MVDREGNEVKLTNTPNGNVLIWGQSGQGKTRWICRQVEEAVKEGKRVLILDFSGSYTPEERNKNLLTTEGVYEFDLSKRPLQWISSYQKEVDLCSDLADALLKILKIHGYVQRKWLKQLLQSSFEQNKSFSIPQFVCYIEKILKDSLNSESDAEDIEAIQKVLTRLVPLENLGNLSIAVKERQCARCLVTIIQMSSLAMSERKFLTELVLELIWKETKFERGKRHCDTLVLDELQVLDLRRDSAVACFLREGRKFEMEAILGSQFISHYPKETLQTLMQAGHLIIFKPSPDDVRFSAKMIDPVNTKNWERVLTDLSVGEAAVKGSYHINGKSSLCEEPLVCST